MLRAYLDYHRDTFRWKTGGLTQEQMSTAHPPSTLTLAGLLKHLALVEDWWFGVIWPARRHGALRRRRLGRHARLGVRHRPRRDARSTCDDLYERAVASCDAHIEAAADVGVIAVDATRGRGEGSSACAGSCCT